MPPCDPVVDALSRRRFLGLSGGLLAAAALAGCGGSTAQRPATGPAPTSEAGGVGVTLDQWYHQYGEEGTEAAVERYAAAYPHATVDVSWKPGDYDQTVADALEGTDGPDVFEYANGPTIDMIRRGQVVELDDVFGDALEDFNPALIKRVTHDGRLWAVPQVADMQLLLYRPSLLAAAGVQPPTTIDELRDAAAALTTEDVAGLFVGNDGGARLMGPPMLRSAGFDLLTEDDTFGFDDPAAAASLGVLRELYTSGHLLLDAPVDWFAGDALARGLTAMQFTGLWNLPALQAALDDDLGVLPWPAGDGGHPNVTVGAYGACVNAGSRHVEVAKDLVRWLWVEGTEMQIDFATAYGLHIPARRSLAAEAKALHDPLPTEAVALASTHGYAQDHMLWTGASETAFTDMMARIVEGGADPAAEIARLRPFVESELHRVRG
ncbi:MAG: extracellular solute-binding protein [Mobilicoccus sp.]|nr:extracellular solute-binding protein [Mobilicoccus sp.]